MARSQHGNAVLWNARGSADYDLSSATRLSGEARFTRFDIDILGQQHFEVRDATGAPTLVFDTPQRFTFARENGAVQGTVRHKFAGDDHELVVNLSRERTNEQPEQAITQVATLPAAPNLFTDLHTVNTLDLTQLKADYTRPMPAQAKLKAGYDLRIDENRYDNVGVRGVSEASAGPDPSQTNLFLYKQTINAGYVTYEQPFGDWTVLGGLRLENVERDLNQVTSRLANSTSTFDAYPSLHLAYRVADDQQLTLSYSKRVQRPNPQDLNPFVVQGDQLNLRAGNPNLQPQVTNSFEAGYQYKANGTFYLATGYYRQNDHGVTDVITTLANGALLTTKENLSQSRAAGVELVANGHLTKTLSYNLSTNLYWNEIDAVGLGFAGRRSAFTVGGRGSLNWQATPKDLVQVTAQVMPKRLLPQGFSEPMVLTFMGYRHKLSDQLSFVFTAQDPLNSYRFRQRIDTPTLKERTVDRARVRAAFVGLNWSFGAATKKPQGFDFGGAAPQ
jgi:outer membrane receptor protein involved in Fe transport